VLCQRAGCLRRMRAAIKGQQLGVLNLQPCPGSSDLCALRRAADQPPQFQKTDGESSERMCGAPDGRPAVSSQTYVREVRGLEFSPVITIRAAFAHKSTLEMVMRRRLYSRGSLSLSCSRQRHATPHVFCVCLRRCRDIYGVAAIGSVAVNKIIANIQSAPGTMRCLARVNKPLLCGRV
jgi:hypothetical protein